MVKVKKKYMDWSPREHSVFKDHDLAKEIHEIGYKVLPLLDKNGIANLNALYEENHTLNMEDGGMFYSMYSKDKAYRYRVHGEISKILTPILEDVFKDYKNVINAFVVKGSGGKSEFYVHQDTTALDEFKHSPISLWIPLHDIEQENGAMCLVEKTHWFFSPYRGVSFQFPFTGINDVVRSYLKPITMKAGEVLIFDPRVIHNSLLNKSGKNRLAVICGIFPAQAKFVTCFQDSISPESPIELYEHNDSYLLEYPNFFYECHERPSSGEVIGTVDENFPEMTSEEFELLCKENNISKQNLLDSQQKTACEMIAEPDGINKFDTQTAAVNTSEKKKISFLQKIFSSNR